MLLRGHYYKIDGWSTEEGETTFRVDLLPDCDVYRGHFPGKPVCPGVCNVQMLKECAEVLTGRRLTITAIRQCRFTAVASPGRCPWVDISLRAEPLAEGYAVTARIAAGSTTYLDFKGEMHEQQA